MLEVVGSSGALLQILTTTARECGSAKNNSDNIVDDVASKNLAF